MVFKEEKGNLFEVSSDYAFAQCISADFAMGAGIAVEFNNRYDQRNKMLLKYGPMIIKHACCLTADNKVYNLITKAKCWQKPTYDSLTRALYSMKEMLKQNNVSKLAMPKIGCGLDRLEWDSVKDIIYKVFSDTDIEILVYYL